MNSQGVSFPCRECGARSRTLQTRTNGDTTQRTRICENGHRFYTREVLDTDAVRGSRKKDTDEAGDAFGEWTLVKYIAGCAAPRRSPKWLCRCSCGVQRAVQVNNLRQGRSTSCGHDLAEKMAEGMRRYHREREQQQASPVATAPMTAGPWDVLRTRWAAEAKVRA